MKEIDFLFSSRWTSAKHSQHHISALVRHHNERDADTTNINQIADIVSGMDGKHLRYRELIADNRPASEAWC